MATKSSMLCVLIEAITGGDDALTFWFCPTTGKCLANVTLSSKEIDFSFARLQFPSVS